MVPKTTLTIRSKAFAHWKAREADENRRVTIDEIIATTGLSKNTVRRLLDPDEDVSSNTLASLVIMARYFGVSLSDIVDVSEGEESGAGEQKAATSSGIESA